MNQARKAKIAAAAKPVTKKFGIKAPTRAAEVERMYERAEATSAIVHAARKWNEREKDRRTVSNGWQQRLESAKSVLSRAVCHYEYVIICQEEEANRKNTQVNDEDK